MWKCYILYIRIINTNEHHDLWNYSWSLWSICTLSQLNLIIFSFFRTCNVKRHVWMSILCIISPENTSVFFLLILEIQSLKCLRSSCCCFKMSPDSEEDSLLKVFITSWWITLIDWWTLITYFMLICNQHYDHQQQLGNNWTCFHIHLFFICLGRISFGVHALISSFPLCQINSTHKTQASAAQDGRKFTINVWINPPKTVLPTLLQWNTLMAAQKVTQRRWCNALINM